MKIIANESTTENLKLGYSALMISDDESSERKEQFFYIIEN